jgi:glycosyltransferase involved in cell wall biosynthesis
MEAAYSGFPNVITIHGNMKELHRLGFHGAGLYGYLAAKLESHVFRKTRGVFCNSAYTEGLVAPRAKRTWRVPNPIRQPFFGPLAPARPTPEKPRIVNVGLVGPRKRQLELLKMAADLHAEGHVFELVFAGGIGTASEYDRAFAKALNSAEQAGYARFVGFLDIDSLIQLLDGAEGFVHFPVEEAFGLVVAEALARGLKFFGADLGGIRDIAEGVPGAELHTSIPGLQAAIIDWLGQGAPVFPVAAEKMKKLYSPEVVARRHVEIYRKVLR